MSRIGNKPIVLPKDVKVTIAGNKVSVKGPKGELSRTVPAEMTVTQKDNVVTVTRPSDNRIHRSLHGLTRSLVANMVEGVSKGFQKSLEIQGVGYRAQKAGDKISIQAGFTAPIEVAPPPGITLALESPTKINVSGSDKELVGRIAAEIRKLRPPDPYKGKGIRYAGEYVRHKAGKTGKVAKKA